MAHMATLGTNSESASDDKRVLSSWKSIAAYFGCNERTAKRWEERGLPVHRVPGEKRGYVFAYTSELDAWLQTIRLKQPGLANCGPENDPDRVLQGAEASLVPAADTPVQITRLAPLKTGLASHWKLFWGTGGVVILLGTFVGLRTLVNRNTGADERGHGRDPAIVSRHVPAPGAEDLYLQGRYFWNLRTSDGLTKAINAFTQAIVKDPSYAEAYAGLAETYDLLPEFTHTDIDGSFLRAEEASDRAIALDPNLAAAHRAKAFALYFRDWDIAGSDAEFRRALALDPNSAETHQWYASSLQCREEGKEALRQIDEARRLNPASPAIAAEAAYFQADFGDLGAGMRELKEIEQTQPTLSSAALFLDVIDFAIGDYPAYIADTRRYASITRNPDDVLLADSVARGWAQGGRTGLLQARAKAMKTAFGHGSESGFLLGETLVLLGRQKEALPYFKASLNSDVITLTMLQNCPWARTLVNDPDYAALFAEIRKRMHGGYPHTPSVIQVSLR